jgi:DNA-binding CsgD family transcriptional regulator
MPRKPSGRRPGRPAHPEILTPAEQRVLEHLRQGLPNAEIGVRLGISPDAVKFHVSNMLGKLNLTNRQELAAWQPGREPVLGRRWAGVPLFKWLAGAAAVGTAAVAGVAILFVALPRENHPGADASLPAGMVSVAPDGTPGNGLSGRSSLSTGGRFVAFESKATNLVANDTNGAQDIFLRDRKEGTTVRVSVGIAGAEANGQSSAPAISEDGRFVAFVSSATNLTNNGSMSDDDIIAALPDISRGVLEKGPPDQRSAVLAVLRSNIYVYNVEKRSTELISVAMDGRPGNLPSGTPSISADGRYVAFDSAASDLVPNDTNGKAPGLVSDQSFAGLVPTDVFIRDRTANTTTRVSVATGGAQAEGSSAFATISADGNFVAFVSDATNLNPGAPASTAKHLHLHNIEENTTIDVPVADPTRLGQVLSIGTPALSANGRWLVVTLLAFQSSPGGGNPARNQMPLYLFDSHTGALTVVGQLPHGNGPEQASLAISDDGRLALGMYSSAPPGLGISTFDLPSGTPQEITPALTIDEGAAAYILALSGDGRTLAFTAPIGTQSQVVAQPLP